jgi:hypothetical protein
LHEDKSTNAGLSDFDALGKLSPKDRNVQANIAADYLKVGTILAKMGATKQA